MAVPGSGILTMLGIAQERKFSTYGTGTISNPILYTDLINGGGLNSFPALKTSCNTTPTYSLNSWYGYDQDCVPPESGVASMNVNGNFLNRTGWSDGVVGSSTGTSISKALIGGTQTSGAAVVTGVYGLTTQNGNLKFSLNNGDNGTTNVPDDWNTLKLQWSDPGGGTITATYTRTNASVSKQFGQYLAKDWVWTWVDSGSSTSVPWSPNTASVTWTISQ
jgi:hypothetical protein